MTRFLYWLGGFCTRRRVPVLLVWLVIVVALAALARGVGEQTSDNLVLPGTDSQQATDTLDDHFPEQANGTNPIALEAPRGQELTDAPYKDAIDDVVKAYRARQRASRRWSSPLSSDGAGAAQQGRVDRATSRCRSRTARASSASTRRRRSSTWRIR